MYSLSTHVQKRMAQRAISRRDIEDALTYGSVNLRKSTKKAKFLELSQLKVVISHEDIVVTAFNDEGYELKEEIAFLTQQADQLAKEFKQYFELAQASYAAGLRAEAKSYSLLGHKLKDTCHQLNQQANVLREVLIAGRP